MLANFTLMAVVFSWFLAQSSKVVIYRFQEGHWNFWHFFEAGGMPSAHSAAVVSLTWSVGLTVGWDSALFTACAVFALIVMYDATGVRRAAGKQAEILNRVVDDIYATGKIKIEKLKEILGHDPIEVIAGASLATVVTLVMYLYAFIK
ncbi:MAG: divergent PAP2 family protein [Candidatus Margulisbacteria bacterium]|nr:divergent PAP2 family protein [Candidatus Margulisiibacteriota bacterium]